MELSRGQRVILLKVRDFNQIIFISVFVVKVHSSVLQRQARKKRRERRVKQNGMQLVVGDINVFYCTMT